jgi:HicB family
MTPQRPDLHVRLPGDLTERLRELAAQQGVSLNALMVALIAGSVGWRLDSKEEHMPTTEAGRMGWITLTSRESDSYLDHGGLRVYAKTARRGRELFVSAEHPGRHTLFWLDPETLALIAMTTGRTDQEAWDAMDAIRRNRR